MPPVSADWPARAAWDNFQSSGEHATHSVASADIDNDGWVDVFVGHELSPSQLFRNNGDGTFQDITARAGVGASTVVKGTAFGDYDNDGWLDCLLRRA